MTLTDKTRPDSSTKQRNNKFESVVSVVINTQSNYIQHRRVYVMDKKRLQRLSIERE